MKEKDKVFPEVRWEDGKIVLPDSYVARAIDGLERIVRWETMDPIVRLAEGITIDFEHGGLLCLSASVLAPEIEVRVKEIVRGSAPYFSELFMAGEEGKVKELKEAIVNDLSPDRVIDYREEGIRTGKYAACVEIGFNHGQFGIEELCDYLRNRLKNCIVKRGW